MKLLTHDDGGKEIAIGQLSLFRCPKNTSDKGINLTDKNVHKCASELEKNCIASNDLGLKSTYQPEKRGFDTKSEDEKD